jgi:hypothetical protein
VLEMHRRCATGGRRGREGFIFGDATDVDMWYCAVAIAVVVVTVMVWGDHEDEDGRERAKDLARGPARTKKLELEN